MKRVSLQTGRNTPDSSPVWIKFFLTLTFIAFIVVAYSLFKETYKKYQIQKEVEELRLEAQELEQGNQKLKGLIEYFKTQNFSEKEARGKLNVKKEGETVVILKTPKELEDEVAATEETENTVSLNLPNPLKWWNYFFYPRNTVTPIPNP